MRLHSFVFSIILMTSSFAIAGSYNGIATDYVKLVLALGELDPLFVDAYYGPEGWREEAHAKKKPLTEIGQEARGLILKLQQSPEPVSEMEKLRKSYLIIQLQSVVSRTEILQGKKMSFDEESSALYKALPPTHPYSYYDEKLKRVEALLPGEGTLAERYLKFRQKFIIPADKLDTVVRRALAECRSRTAAHIQLPGGENFEVAYVHDKPWGAYNWYKGSFHSLIEVNTDQPSYIDQPIGLACHEGYPGHHVYNALLESLLKEKGWVEFTVYALFSPQSLIAEGSANYGVDLAFPREERKKFETSVLFPLTGLDTKDADRFYQLREIMEDLSYVTNDVARDYLGGKINHDQAVELIQKYSVTTPERAARQVRFIETYRSYVINYNLGKDLVRDFIESSSGDDLDKRWQKFAELISSPRLLSNLPTN